MHSSCLIIIYYLIIDKINNRRCGLLSMSNGRNTVAGGEYYIIFQTRIEQIKTFILKLKKMIAHHVTNMYDLIEPTYQPD